MPINPVVSDFTKLPHDILVDLINYDNGTVLTPDSVTFGVPTPSGGTRNTLITVNAAQGSTYTGSVDLQYNRIDLSTVPIIAESDFIFNVYENRLKISDIVNQINTQYKINLRPEDYFDADLPFFTDDDVVPNATKDFKVIARPGSLIFVGEATLKVSRGVIDLSEIILNTVLNGLIYLKPTP